MAASTSSSSMISTSDNNQWKTQFYAELHQLKNDSSNNPIFTPERYQQTVDLIMGAKLKRYSERSEQEVSLMKTYDLVNFGSQMKLVKKMDPSGKCTTSLIVKFVEVATSTTDFIEVVTSTRDFIEVITYNFDKISVEVITSTNRLTSIRHI
jgi:hypothetical protein